VALCTGPFETLKAGKVMVSATATGQAFSFTVPPSMDAAALMTAADVALAWYDSKRQLSDLLPLKSEVS
jgi:hypothetical protein